MVEEGEKSKMIPKFLAWTLLCKWRQYLARESRRKKRDWGKEKILGRLGGWGREKRFFRPQDVCGLEVRRAILAIWNSQTGFVSLLVSKTAPNDPGPYMFTESGLACDSF